MILSSPPCICAPSSATAERAQWPTKLNLKLNALGRRQTAAVIRLNFPAIPAEKESKCYGKRLPWLSRLTLDRLKCDRKHPCGGCSKRGQTTSCRYVNNATATHSRPSSSSAQPRNLHGRMAELESLVMTLMEGQPLLTPSPSPSFTLSMRATTDEPSEVPNISNHKVEVPPPDPGTLNLRDSHTSYVQSGHWEAVLTKIRGLKEDLITDDRALPGSHIFYGTARHVSRDEILSAIPPRAVVDRLISVHFEASLVTPCR